MWLAGTKSSCSSGLSTMPTMPTMMMTAALLCEALPPPPLLVFDSPPATYDTRSVMSRYVYPRSTRYTMGIGAGGRFVPCISTPVARQSRASKVILAANRRLS